MLIVTQIRATRWQGRPSWSDDLSDRGMCDSLHQGGLPHQPSCSENQHFHGSLLPLASYSSCLSFFESVPVALSLHADQRIEANILLMRDARGGWQLNLRRPPRQRVSHCPNEHLQLQTLLAGLFQACRENVRVATPRPASLRPSRAL